MPDTNLFNPTWTQGDLNTIDSITGVVGMIVVTVVSIVGFGIVMVTILKNSLAGLYAVYPGFWDKVDEAHRVKIREAITTNVKEGNEFTGAIKGIAQVIYGIIPNVKAMTAFKDDGNGAPVLDAKNYFMKAIPLACVTIFIGVFIFFGYPAQIAEKISVVGTNVLDMFIANFDPVSWVQKIPDKYAVYQLRTDGSDDPVDKTVNDIAHDCLTAYVGFLDDMTADSRVAVSTELEDWVEAQVTGSMYQYANNPEGYKRTHSVRVVSGEPNLERINGVETSTGIQFGFYAPLTQWESGSTVDMTNKYLRITISFTKKATIVTTDRVTCNVTVGGGLVNVTDKNKPTIQFAASGNGSVATSARYCTLKTVSGIQYQGTITNGVLTLVCQSNKPLSSLNGETFTCSGLVYKYGSTSHEIKTLTVKSSGSTLTFAAQNAEGKEVTWTVGDDPMEKVNGESSTTK